MRAKLWIIFDIEKEPVLYNLSYSLFIPWFLYINTSANVLYKTTVTRPMVRTQQDLQNECMVKTDQTARIRRLMSIFASFLSITFIGYMYFKVIIIIMSCSNTRWRSSRHSRRQQQ